MMSKLQTGMAEGLSAAQCEVLCKVLRGHRAVACAYLFGSAVQGTMTPQSDVDIGVLLKEDHDSEDALVSLEADLSRRVTGRPVDLLSLSRAPCHVAYQIIRDGHLLVNKDPAAKESFEVRTITDYLDFKPMRDILLQGVRRAILRTA